MMAFDEKRRGMTLDVAVEQLDRDLCTGTAR